jgi:hypothetical protein
MIHFCNNKKIKENNFNIELSKQLAIKILAKFQSLMDDLKYEF